MATILQKTKDSIFYQLPQGKPDPKALCSPSTMSSRSMVPQEPQKGSTCWYYALNMIRDRVGKNPSEEVKDKRHIEVICSERRKAFSMQRALQNQQISIAQALKTDPRFSPYLATTIPGARALLPKLHKMSLVAGGEAKEKLNELISILSSFLSQSAVPDLIDYLNNFHFSEMNKVNLLMLKKMGIDPEAFYREESFYAQNLAKYGTFARYVKEKPIEAAPILDSYAFRAAHRGYGLLVSSFDPTRGAESLKDALEHSGPMYCKGKFGKAYYLVEPSVVEQIASKNIWGWKKTDAKRELSIAHSIVVVGAKTSEGASGGFVYFVDPIDGSHPENPEQQKVYVMSYKGFISKLGDLKNRMHLNEEGIQTSFSFDAGYGLHAPRPTSA